MQTKKLPNGFEIPVLGIGTYGMGGDKDSADYSKDKDILSQLVNPIRIPNKETRSFVEDILHKYIDILPDKGSQFFKTQRFKKKKEIQTGVKLKGF